MKSRGFTLLEVITAIFILTVGVGGAFSLIHQTLSIASLSELKLTGAYLAQEGMEIVRNIRDKAWLEKRTGPAIMWDEYLPVGNWKADYLTQNLTQIYSGTLLNIDANGFYGYSAGTPTKFKRKILIEKPEIDKIKVTVEVLWEERGRTHSVEVLEYLTNWYEQ